MNILKNRKGFTLLELIIIIVVLGIIMGSVVSSFALGLRFFTDEDSSIVRQENLRLVAVTFEKDVRKSSSQTVTTSGSCATIDTIVYCLSGTNVTKNSNVLASNVDQFSVVLSADATFIDLILSSTPDTRNNDVDISTRIYLRKGD